MKSGSGSPGGALGRSGAPSASKGGGKIAGLYDLEETLGSGHFAVVKLARHVFTGEKVAVKVIDKTKLDEVSRAHLFQEVRCMKLVQHPNVVRLYEVIDTQTKLYLILELGDGGDLYDYIMRHESGLSEDLARDYFRQIVRAISYCHRLHVVHRDLKPENVVFFRKLGIVKLTDFGFSNKFCPGQKLETSCGSLAYSAPEILLGDSYDAPAVDVWSLGVILYMLVCGHAPFHEANDSETLTMIMDCKYIIPQHVSSQCKSLIGRMLVRQPEKRASLSQISSDPWVQAVNSTTANNSPEAPTEDNLPLVSRQQLSDEDHTIIVQKMVNGQIASKEQILEGLEKNEYNHVTATYYLLAERKLRAERQDQIVVKRPEVLGVGMAGMVATSDGGKGIGDSRLNRLMVPSQPAAGLLLAVPRTPGDVPQRARKCSIVREEEDDEEGSSAGRRGSRSEGRLHLALQERIPPTPHPPNVNNLNSVSTALPLAQTTQLKVHPGSDPRGNLASAINKVNLDDENTRSRLGNAGMGSSAGWMMSIGKKNRFGEQTRPKSAIEQSGLSGITKNPLPLLCEDDTPPTLHLKDAATVSIPLRKSPAVVAIPMQAYKTLPSPVRPPKHSFEPKVGLERRDEEIGRGPGGPGGQQRRAKYHKGHRTASCSSSDASDEDSEGRKKRPPRPAADPAQKPLSQRRDSHDDSSDSQERGGAGGGGSNSSSRGTHTVTGGNSGSVKEGNAGGGGGGGLTGRHRGGRRSGETRLRESQSLNRITEAQEAEATPARPVPRPRGFFHPGRLFGRRPPTRLPPDGKGETGGTPAAPKPPDEVSPAPGFTTSPARPPRIPSEEKENCPRPAVAVEKRPPKKVRLLSRYFRVHRKLCLPRLPALPGLPGHGGRLYKAQSCGSIVRDKIASAGASSLLLVNELCRDRPLVGDTHRARIELIADAAPLERRVPLPGACRVHPGALSECCGPC